jgi:hypothetical protein
MTADDSIGAEGSERPDPVETDAAALSASQSLDEDNLGEDPLEKGIEPPEQWAAADGFGTTASEQRAGETLDQRLAQEQPDVGEARTPPTDTEAESAQGRGQNADTAGGSVADAIREPRGD